MDWQIVDIVLVSLVAILAIVTPAKSPYRLINIVLASEFALAFGVGALCDMYLDEGYQVYLIKAVKDAAFVGAFFFVGGRILAQLSSAMASYHIAIAIVLCLGSEGDVGYSWVMAVFCVSQVLCGFIGWAHGIHYCSSIDRVLNRIACGSSR